MNKYQLIEYQPICMKKKQAEQLLSFEETIPQKVSQVMEYCEKHRIGYVLSRNVAVDNCRVARSYRNRLGHIGVPLCDELKTRIVKADNKHGDKVIFALHLRGNAKIDDEQLANELDVTSIIQLDDFELFERFDMELGTVMPFLLELNFPNEYINIFEKGLLTPCSRYPATMMTNAGEKTWAIEFDPVYYINLIQNKKILSFAVLENDIPSWEFFTQPKTIGIITGNGPDSGMALWNGINSHIREAFGKKHFLGDISFPSVYIASMPTMGLSMELDKRLTATWDTIEQAIDKLLRLDIEILALACHTTHYFTNEIREKLKNTSCIFISMPEVAINYIFNQGIKELAILGINYVADLEQWSAYSQLKEIHIEKLEPSTIQKMHELGYKVKSEVDIHSCFQKLKALITDEIICDNVLIALTELSIILERQGKKNYKSRKNVIDALDLYSKKIAEESLGVIVSDKP